MTYNYKEGILVPFVQKFYKQMIVVVAALFIASMGAMTFNASALVVNGTCNFDNTTTTGVWSLQGDCDSDGPINIPAGTTVEGNNFTIRAGYNFGSNAAGTNTVIGVINADNVTIKDLVIDGTNGLSLHGINVYLSDSLQIENVTTMNNDKSGLVVNGSDVTVNDITTSGNGWHGINVDLGSGVTDPALLTVNGVSSHDELVQIRADKYGAGVEVVDTNSQYVYKLTGSSRFYRLSLAAPVHTSPADGSYRTTATQTLIDWEDVSDPLGPVTYLYQSSTNPDTSGPDGAFVSPVYNSGVLTSSQIATPNTPQGVWYWHVRAVDALGNMSNWSDPWMVTVDNTAPAIPSPISMKEDNGELSNLTNGGFTNSYSVTTSWGSVADAASYEYSYWNDIPSSPYKEGSRYTVSNGSSTSRSGVFNQGEGKHLVAVRAVDAAGNKSDWSTTFAITYDATAPVVTVESPVDGAVVAGDVDVYGTVVDDNLSHYNASLYPSTTNLSDGGTHSGDRIVDSGVVSTVEFTNEVVLSFDSTTLADGIYQVRLAARDLAGNRDLSDPYNGGISSVHVITVVVDNYVDVKDDCKNDSLLLAMFDGTVKTTFRNQGDCVSYFATANSAVGNNPATNGDTNERANSRKNR